MRYLNIIKIGDKNIKLKNVISPNQIANYARAMTRANKDCPLIISGFAGDGKSTLAIQIARAFDKKYTHERNMIYSRDEMKTKINNFKPSALTIDESMNVLYKRDWGTRGQKEIIKLLDICRYKKHLIMFIQPHMMAVDSHVRDTRVRLWILVLKRGLAAVFKPLRQLNYEDPWRLKDNDIILKKHIKKSEFEIEGKIEGCFHCENFLGFVTWEDIDKKDYESYQEVKDKKKEAYQEVKLFTPDEAKRLSHEKIFEILAILKHHKKLKPGSYEFIGAELSLSNESVSAAIKRASIRKGITEAQIFKEKMESKKEDYLT